MRIATLWATFLGASVTVSDSTRPPTPDFRKPVDYIGWYNKFVSKGKTKNANDVYMRLVKDAGTDGTGLQPKAEAADQIEKVAGAWDSAACPELAEYLQQMRPHTSTFKEAAGMKDAWMPAEPGMSTLMEMKLPTLIIIREVSKAMRAEALMKQPRQADALLNSCEVVLQTANHLQQGAMVISQLVGISERSLVYDLIRCGIADQVISEDRAAEAIERISKLDPGGPRWDYALVTEWGCLLNDLQFIFPDLKPSKARWHRVLEAAGVAAKDAPDIENALNPQSTLESIDRFYTDMIARSSRPPSMSGFRRFEASNKEHRSRAQNEHNVFLMVFLPDLTRAYRQALRCESQRRGTLLTMALYAYHARHGAGPDLSMPWTCRTSTNSASTRSARRTSHIACLRAIRNSTP